MASQTYNLNTWAAKRIIGDTAAASADSALLQTGAGIAANTWLLHRTNRTTKLYGIKYIYDSNDHDKIEFYGASTSTESSATPSAWVQLDTGDAYFKGLVGIGTDTLTYRLNVAGQSYLNGAVGINTTPSTYILDVNGTSYLKGTATTNSLIPDTDATYTIGEDDKRYTLYHASTGYRIYTDTTLTSDDGFIEFVNNAQYLRLAAVSLGTDSQVGIGRLDLGNATASGTAGNARGAILMYGTNNQHIHLRANTGSAAQYFYFPSYQGSMSATHTADEDAVGSDTSGAAQPVYVAAKGRLTAISNAISVAYGGTGVASHTGNRLVYSNSGGTAICAYDKHYVDDTHIGINTTTAPSTTLYVNGTTYTNNNITTTGTLIFDFTGSTKAKQTIYSAISLKYKTTDNANTYTLSPIRYMGNDESGVANNGILLYGSTSGMTWLTAGESGSTLPTKLAYNNENLYLSADGSIEFYTSVANDGNTYSRTLNLSGGTATFGSSALTGQIRIWNTTASHYVAITPANDLSGDRTWTIPNAAGNRYFVGSSTFPFTKNAVFYAGDTTYAAQIASANGALYATAANGALSWGTLPIAQGGTGKTSWTAGGIVYASATNTLAQIADGSADKVLRSTASATYSWLSYTSASTASTIVYRDASKNFSAGMITANLTGNVTGNADTSTQVKVTAAPVAITKDYILFSATAPTSTATAHTVLSSGSMWINSADKGKFEFVLGNTTATSTAGGQFGQLALYSAGTKGTYLKSADNSTAWYTATLPAATGTICYTDGTGASGSWGISISGSAAKLGTATVGDSNRPIYLNAGTATAVSWYYNSCTISGGNKANYPWHRFATCTTGTGQYADKTAIIILHSRYNGGPYGMVKLSMRTNATGAAKSTSAVWIYRSGFAVDDIKISAPVQTTGTDETINAYIKCGTYPRRIAYILEGSNIGWSLVSSSEPNDTTTSDKKGGTEINASASGNNATDGATVSYANTAGTADNVAWANTNHPSTFTPSAHNHGAGDINSGTLGVARGGTGASSFTANSIIMSGSSTTAALTTKGIFTRSSVGDSGWGTTANRTLIPDMSLIAYWNGCYSGTTSNLQYCDRGRFGTIVTKASGDYAPSSTVSCTTANVKSALGTVSTTAKKFLKDTGGWAQVAWEDLSGVPSTFAPSTHNHDSSYLKLGGGTITGWLYIKNDDDAPRISFTSNDSTGATGGFIYMAMSQTNSIYRPNRYCFRIFSYNSSTGATDTSHYETYQLPSVAAGMTGTKTYNILTDKDLTFSITGSAASATKDGSGNTITSYYCTLSTAQTFTGNKTFNSICYFANGTTYYVNKSGTAVLNALTVNATTASSSTATGALIVKGGLGVAGDAYIHQVCISAYGGAYGTGGEAKLWYNGSSNVTASGESASRLRSNKDFHAPKVYGAVWNDYAECRQVEMEEPGRCVTESSNGKMVLTQKRLMPGCKLISDTFGICMGETEIAKTPIAVAGRVLAYTYQSKDKYPLGAAVCSAPNGTIDVMSRDEIMMYPERIIGTVSEIPTYDVWHGGSKESPTDIQVNGRIWIYVR